MFVVPTFPNSPCCDKRHPQYAEHLNVLFHLCGHEEVVDGCTLFTSVQCPSSKGYLANYRLWWLYTSQSNPFLKSDLILIVVSSVHVASHCFIWISDARFWLLALASQANNWCCHHHTKTLLTLQDLSDLPRNQSLSCWCDIHIGTDSAISSTSPTRCQLDERKYDT